MKDALSVQRIAQLHPLVRELFTSFITECETAHSVTLRITLPVYRSVSEQNAIYAQGRTTKGAIVTNAKGGQSFHNYGLAVDLCELKNGGEIDWSYDMKTLTDISVKYGIEWGGSWHTITDKPHFQKTFGYTWQQLLELYDNKNVDGNGYVKIVTK